MDKSFFWYINLINLVAIALTFVQLFLPIFLRVDLHYDMNRRKFAFAVYLFKIIRVLSGYIATYTGGIAIHLSTKKAIVIPYRQLSSERKRISLMRIFRLQSLTLTTETGAEYLLGVALAHTFFRIYFFAQGGKKENLENNFWLTDGDILRISASIVLRFQLYDVLVKLFQYIKEKMKILWQKKMKKSTV